MRSAALSMALCASCVSPPPVAPAPVGPVAPVTPVAQAAAPANAVERVVGVPRRLDGSLQPARVLEPPGPIDGPAPLLVLLHTWSADHTQRHEAFEQGALDRGWYVVVPEFGGPNDDPQACGSDRARSDVIEAVDWMRQSYAIDASRVYLAGVSGGGHMALLLAGRAPSPWAAVSAWVPPTDLVSWYALHSGDRYGAMLRAVTGGPPGLSEEVDREYRERSPVHWLDGARGIPVEISAGIRDGHEGSVPISHTLHAFNVLARANGGDPVTAEEITTLSRPDAPLDTRRPAVHDPDLGREVILRRRAGPARVTIFDGGHEGIGEAALTWLESHRRAGGN